MIETELSSGWGGTSILITVGLIWFIINVRIAAICCRVHSRFHKSMSGIYIYIWIFYENRYKSPVVQLCLLFPVNEVSPSAFCNSRPKLHQMFIKPKTGSGPCIQMRSWEVSSCSRVRCCSCSPEFSTFLTAQKLKLWAASTWLVARVKLSSLNTSRGEC